MTPLWTAAEAVAATGGQASSSWTAVGVSIDSRAVAPGDLFVALEGPNHDAHAFVADALKRGAGAAMVARHPDGLPGEVPLLVVEDTLAGLTALGRTGRARAAAHVVAVTGSVGKTGTKEALRTALAAQASTHASAASHNNHWGVPLSLARLPRDAVFAVLELGMNHAGEIAGLTRLARPHVALITTVEPAHLEFLGSIEAIADAKGEIFEGLEPGGTAVLNRDNPMFDRLRRRALDCGAARVLGFGVDPAAEIRAVEAVLDAEGSDVLARIDGRELRYRVGIAGRHWVQNSLAVLAAVTALGADPVAAAQALADLRATSGRGARHEIAVGDGAATLIDESYNGNPASIRAALEVLGRLPGRRVLVLGDMLELGPTAAELHAGLAEAVAAAGVERIYSCGPLMQRLFEAVPARRRGAHADNAKALLPLVVAGLRPGDVVLVKGSLGSRMGPIAAALRDGTAAGATRRAG